MNLRGIYFQREGGRFYPKRELAAHVLGYVDIDGKGLGGIEYALDENIRSKPGKILVLTDARRRGFDSTDKVARYGHQRRSDARRKKSSTSLRRNLNRRSTTRRRKRARSLSKIRTRENCCWRRQLADIQSQCRFQGHQSRSAHGIAPRARS